MNTKDFSNCWWPVLVTFGEVKLVRKGLMQEDIESADAIYSIINRELCQLVEGEWQPLQEERPDLLEPLARADMQGEEERLKAEGRKE